MYHLQSITWASQDILFGHNKFDLILNKIFFLGEVIFFYKNKFNNFAPRVPIFLRQTRYRFITEQVNIAKGLKIEKVVAVMVPKL